MSLPSCSHRMSGELLLSVPDKSNAGSDSRSMPGGRICLMDLRGAARQGWSEIYLVLLFCLSLGSHKQLSEEGIANQELPEEERGRRQ